MQRAKRSLVAAAAAAAMLWAGTASAASYKLFVNLPLTGAWSA